MIGDVFFRVGQAIAALEGRAGGAGAATAAGAASARGSGGGPDDPADGWGRADLGDEEAELDEQEVADTLPDDSAVAAGAILSALGTWVATRLLRPKPVSWPRVVIAGAGAALLADLVGRMQDDDAAPGLPYAHDPAELLGRVSAGVAIAAGYASILYPRLPGPGLLRGLAFGALEVAAAPRGGLVRIAARTPGFRFPLQALALPVDEDASPLAHLAFGVGLGLLYREGARDEDLDELEDDELEDDDLDELDDFDDED